MDNLSNWWSDYWEQHSSEIIWAAVFAVIAAVIVGFFWDQIKKAEIFIKLKKKVKKIWRQGSKVFHPGEIANSIESHYPIGIPSRFVIDAVQKHDALTINSRFHYQSFDDSYHACRFFKILSIVNGDETFFREICKAMATDCDSVEVDMFLSIKKPANKIFSDQFVGQNWPRRLLSHSINCFEKKWPDEESGDYCVEFEYEEGESLEGVKVILLEAFLLFPPTLLRVIEWLGAQGAIVQKIVILFNGTGDRTCFSPCGIDQNDVIFGCSVDMKVAKLGECHCALKNKIHLLKYKDY